MLFLSVGPLFVPAGLPDIRMGFHDRANINSGINGNQDYQLITRI